MNTIRHLFIDLEDTIITPVLNGWRNTELMNIEKIKGFISEFKPDQVHIFSFAIWNRAELNGFNEHTRQMLETALGVQFSTVPTVDDDILPNCSKTMGIVSSLSFSDMSDFWGKQGAFRLNMRQIFKHSHLHDVHTEVVLLDDAVFNEEFHWPDFRLRGRILNIDELLTIPPEQGPLIDP